MTTPGKRRCEHFLNIVNPDKTVLKCPAKNGTYKCYFHKACNDGSTSVCDDATEQAPIRCDNLSIASFVHKRTLANNVNPANFLDMLPNSIKPTYPNACHQLKK